MYEDNVFLFFCFFKIKKALSNILISAKAIDCPS